jgi:hypothetical protein
MSTIISVWGVGVEVGVKGKEVGEKRRPLHFSFTPSARLFFFLKKKYTLFII